MTSRWALVGAGVALLAATFAAGRYTVPAAEVVQYDGVTATVQQWSRTVHHREEARTRVVVRDRVVTPDGTVREHEEERAAEHIVERTDASTSSLATSAETHSKSVTPRQQDWRAGVLVGVNVQLAPQVGVLLERRVLGPFSIGAWLLVQPSPTFNLAGGLAATVSW